MGEEGIFQIYLVNKRKGTNEWVGTVRLEGHRHRSSSRKRGTVELQEKGFDCVSSYLSVARKGLAA